MQHLPFLEGQHILSNSKEGQEYISEYFCDHERKMAEKRKATNRKINLEKLATTEQENRIQLQQYGGREMVEIIRIPME